MIDFHSYEAPAGKLQELHKIMVRRGVDVQLFTDPETDLEIGVFLSTTPIRRQIWHALNPRVRIPRRHRDRVPRVIQPPESPRQQGGGHQ
jgi:hypothetical protein